MKLKTIKKTIHAKMQEWISSIKDEDLRKEVQDNLIVTGGCIATMLLKTPVNDYDVYFKTKNTCLKLAKYYINEANKIYETNKLGLRLEVIDSKNIPEKDFNDSEQTQNQWQFFKRGLEQADEDRIKLYIPNVGYWRRKDYCPDEKQEELEYLPIYLSENAISLSKKIQVVVRFFGDAQQIHENYDFVHATNYFHYENGIPKLVCNIAALQALLTKELIYIGSKYPLTSIIRTKKFLLRGFSINAGEYLKILWQVAELDLKDPVILQEQLIGVDIAYFSKLLEVLQNVPAEKLEYNYIATIIDKVFSEIDDEE